MKTIGLLGGMSWKSTQEYYRILNEEAAKRLGGLSSALILLHSVNLAELHSLQELEEWEAIAAHLGWLGRGLRLAGADFLVVCANTMHRVAEEISLLAELPCTSATPPPPQSRGPDCPAWGSWARCRPWNRNFCETVSWTRTWRCSCPSPRTAN